MLQLPVATALLPLLACWAPIDTTGTQSLYAIMFLSPTLAEPDLAFADDGYGNYLGNNAELLLNHQATLCAAFNLTGAEFALITGNAVPGALGFGAATPLTLANVSAVFRIGWLAHALNLSVLEFLCSGRRPGSTRSHRSIRRRTRPPSRRRSASSGWSRHWRARDCARCRRSICCGIRTSAAIRRHPRPR